MHTINRTLVFTLFVAALLVPFILLFGKSETISNSSANAPITTTHPSVGESQSETHTDREIYGFWLITKILREIFNISDPEKIQWERMNLQEYNLNFGESPLTLDHEWSDDNLFPFDPNRGNANKQKRK